MPFALGHGGPALLVGADGVPYDAENPIPVAGAPAGQAVIPDGDDAAEGAIADAASVAGGVGTVSAKLRLVTTT